MSDLYQRLEFATQLAHQAGNIMLKYFQIGVPKEDKKDGSPVTIADRLVNELVIEQVQKVYPRDGVLAEEASDMKNDAEYLWVCDPIDGTIAYMFGVPVSKFSLALVKDGKPVVGVIYDPYMKRLYHAVKGEGAFLNKSPIRVNKAATLLAGKYVSISTQKVPLIDSGSLVHKQVIEGCGQVCFGVLLTKQC